MFKMPIIESKRFILRPFCKKDAKSLAKNLNNKKISRNMIGIPFPYNLKHAKTFIQKDFNERRKKQQTKFNFAIDVNGDAIGCVALREIEQEKYKASLGYWLGEKYWNKEIMTEAVKLITKFGFEKLKLRRIFANVVLWNKASARVLEKNNYKLEGILRKNVKSGDKFLDTYLFARV